MFKFVNMMMLKTNIYLKTNIFNQEVRSVTNSGAVSAFPQLVTLAVAIARLSFISMSVVINVGLENLIPFCKILG